MVNNFLSELIYLEPLNLFLYTWRFLAELELEAKIPALKTFYRCFAVISIILIPAAFIAIVPAFIIESGRLSYFQFHFNVKEVNHYYNLTASLFKAINIVGPLTNLISCLILAMVMYLVFKLNRKVRIGRHAINKRI